MNAVPKPGASIFERMSDLLGTPLRSELDAVAAVKAGIGAKGYKRLANKLGFDPSLVAPESTVRRRLQQKSRFTTDESERMVRLARVYAEAVELFGDEAAALQWLNTPVPFLPDEAPVTPLELATTDAGARVVEAKIRRTAHGVF